MSDSAGRATALSTPQPRMPWIPAFLLGVWVSAAAIWPAEHVRIARFYIFLWQPVLLATLLLLALCAQRRLGWSLALGRSLWLFVVITTAAWLPYLHITAWPPPPGFFQAYLRLYEVAIGAVIGYQALRVVLQQEPASWWTRDGWARPLVVAPALLIARGIQVGYWANPVIGTAAGAALALARPGCWRTPIGASRLQRLIPLALFLVGWAMTAVAGLRIYSQTGAARFPSASDDGPSYYEQAVKMARDPKLFFTPKLQDQLFFTGYYPLMALWFWVTGGPHVPSWLVIWHGFAGGWLALGIFWLARRLVGTGLALLAAGLTVADHVMLHLMATMNMETFFIPVFYLAIAAWVSAKDEAGAPRPRPAFATGLLLGVATVLRPTSLLFPVALAGGALLERTRQRWRALATQTAHLAAGFAVPMALLYLRNRIAWGAWSLAGKKAYLSMIENYALEVHSQHLANIGLLPWLRLIAADPRVLWEQVLPKLWQQIMMLWVHPGFGKMDLVRGLVDEGYYQAALASILALSLIAGLVVAVRRRTRLDVALCLPPVYFTALVLVFFVLNSRYRSPFIPALYILSCVGLSLARSASAAERPAAPAPALPPRGTLEFVRRREPARP